MHLSQRKFEWLKCRSAAMKIRKVLVPATEQVDSYTVSSNESTKFQFLGIKSAVDGKSALYLFFVTIYAEELQWIAV